MKYTQKGFTLLELSITTILIAMSIIALITMQAHQNQLDTARGIAKTYERLNNAVGSYMTNYYGQLIRLNPQCSRITALVGAAAAPLDGINCALNITTKVGDPIRDQVVNVANGLQPTPAELRALGMLSGADGVAFVNALPLPSYASGGRFQALDPSGRPIPAGFAFVIQFMCVGQQGGPVQIVNQTECLTNSFDLRSLVFNSQPYKLGTASLSSDILLDQILVAAGGDAFLSDLQNGELRSMAGSAVPQIANPIQWIEGNQRQFRGAPFILAMANGFGSSGFDQMVRRDGSLTLTGNWNVSNGANNIDVTGINNLGAVNIDATTGTFSGALSAGSVAANSVNSSTGVFGDLGGQIMQGINAALKATTAYISSALTVGGTLQVDGKSKFGDEATFDKDLNVGAVASANRLTAGDVHVKNSAVLGADCNPASETIRPVNASSLGFDKGFRIAVCDPSGKWVSAQADLSGDILSLNQEVANVNIASIKVNEELDRLDKNITKLDEGFTRLNDNEMRWDIINVDYPPAKCIEQEISNTGSIKCTKYKAEQKVWRKTPWRCNNLGLAEDAAAGEANDGVRWSQYNSDRQKTDKRNAATVPILVGFDQFPEKDVWVYDINCVDAAQSLGNHSEGKYWYVGVSVVNQNISNGNICRSGLGGRLNFETMETYSVPGDCKGFTFNIRNPSFNSKRMGVRFMAFTTIDADRKPGEAPLVPTASTLIPKN
jgi:hypothetical protein